MSQPPKEIEKRVFEIKNYDDFNSCAMEIYRYQAENNKIYKEFVGLLKTEPKTIEEIPFLPIEFFKSHEITTGSLPTEAIIESSGTTGSLISKH